MSNCVNCQYHDSQHKEADSLTDWLKDRSQNGESTSFKFFEIYFEQSWWMFLAKWNLFHALYFHIIMWKIMLSFVHMYRQANMKATKNSTDKESRRVFTEYYQCVCFTIYWR